MEPSQTVESRAKELQAVVARVLEEGLRVLEGVLVSGTAADVEEHPPSVVVISPQGFRGGALEGHARPGPRSDTLILVVSSVSDIDASSSAAEEPGRQAEVAGERQRALAEPACPPGARVAATAEVFADQLSVDGLTLDFARHRAAYGGNPLQLTNREFTLLAVLARSRGRVVSAAEIVREFGNSLPSPGREASDLVKAVVLRTRRKLASVHADPRTIMTVRGVGYMIDTPLALDPVEVTRPGLDAGPHSSRPAGRLAHAVRKLPAPKSDGG